MRYVPRSPWFRAALVLPSARRSRRAPLVARPRLEPRRPRVQSRRLGVDRVRDRSQPRVGARALARLAADHRPGARPAAPALRPGLLRLLDRPACERGAAGPDRGARARRRPAAPPPSRARDDRHARRHGLRAPALRPLSGDPARAVRLLDGEDPALGGHEPDHRAGRSVACSSRSPSRPRSGDTGDPSLDGARPLRRLLVMARQGLAVLRSPLPAAGRSSCKPLAGSCSCSRSTCRCARSTSTRRFRRQGSCCC